MSLTGNSSKENVVGHDILSSIGMLTILMPTDSSIACFRAADILATVRRTKKVVDGRVVTTKATSPSHLVSLRATAINMP